MPKGDLPEDVEFEIVSSETLTAERVDAPGGRDALAEHHPLESVTVKVPSKEEVAADMAEFGQLSPVLAKDLGNAAMCVGDPDSDRRDPADLTMMKIDPEAVARTIANVLWVLPRSFQEQALRRAAEIRDAWPPRQADPES
jgi:hypothetical protein